MAKVRIGTASLSGCLGCHMSILDLRLEELAKEVEIVFSPVAMDVKEPPEADVFFVEGAVSNEEDEELVKKIRERCKFLAAMGDCACLEGMMQMRDLFDREGVLRRAYVETESTKDGKIPSSEEIPPIFERALPIHRIVKIDLFIPGCPPAPKAFHYVLGRLLKGEEPKLPPELLQYD